MPIATRLFAPSSSLLAPSKRSSANSADDSQSFSDVLSSTRSTQADASHNSTASTNSTDSQVKNDRTSSKSQDDVKTKGKNGDGESEDSESSTSQQASSTDNSDSSAASTTRSSPPAEATPSEAKAKPDKTKSDDTNGTSPQDAAVQAALTIAAQTPAQAADAVARKSATTGTTTTVADTQTANAAPAASSDAATPAAPSTPATPGSSPAGKPAKSASNKPAPDSALAAVTQPTKDSAVPADAPGSHAAAPASPAKSAVAPPKASAKALASADDNASSAASSPSAGTSSDTAASPPPVVVAASVQATEVAATLTKPATSADTTAHADNASSDISLASSTPATGKLLTPDRATTASAAQESPASESSQTFDQVVLGLRGKIDARNGKAEIRLDPPNLGTVRISVSLDKGTLTAQFQSSSDSVRDLLKSNMEKLKTVLESQGVAVDRLSVESTPSAAKAPVASDNASAQSSANDGRSAGQYQQNASDQRRSQKPTTTFSRIWREATQDAAPMDVVA